MKRVAILLSILIAVAPRLAQSQTTPAQGQNENDKRACCAESAQTTSTSNQPARVSVKISDGERITLRNRFGPIVVTGSKGDAVEATATVIQQGTGAYKFQVIATRPGKDKIMITTDVLTASRATAEQKEKNRVSAGSSGPGTYTPQPPQKPQPAQSGTPQPPPRAGASGSGSVRAQRAPRPDRTPSPESLRGVGEIKLEVKLPHDARIELVDSRRYAILTYGTPNYLTNTRNNVSVTNIDTPVSIISSGEVQVTKVGAVEVKTRAGNIQIRDVTGLVTVSTVMGAILVKDVDGDVRAVSISGPISIDCAGGRIEASTTNGTVTLSGIGGDVDASTTGGTISFTGAIREDGRYRLRSMSGQVRMMIQREPPGFLASLSSYKGQILVDFELKTELSANTATSDLPATQGQPVRRLIGRYNSGGARLTLDSFSATVQLGRAPSEVWKKCR
jgi:hypothetical protein